MKITKLGHCCLLIEEDGLRILTDPGNYTEDLHEVENVDVVLITHEHADHFHIDSLKKVLLKSPDAEIITNRGVGNHLRKEGIFFTCLEEGEECAVRSVLFQGYGKEHAPIYATVEGVMNTGYFINNKLFYPGDALTDPDREIPILALPVAGPWIKISEAIDYALKLKPRSCFPVHDGGLRFPQPFHRIPEKALKEKGIEFKVLALKEPVEYPLPNEEEVQG